MVITDRNDYDGARMKAPKVIATFAVLMLALSACAGKPKASANPPAQPGVVLTRALNGASVERIKLRKPIVSRMGTITEVVRVKSVPDARNVVFYLPCLADGGCQAQPIPGESRSVVLPSGDVITVSNTTPDNSLTRWTPPLGEGL